MPIPKGQKWAQSTLEDWFEIVDHCQQVISVIISVFVVCLTSFFAVDFAFIVFVVCALCG